jgi:hypothetical protein
MAGRSTVSRPRVLCLQPRCRQCRSEYRLALLSESSSPKEPATQKEKVQDLTEITAYRLGAMYEADYLREQIGLQFPSIFDIKPEDALENLPEKHLTLKTWSLLLSHDINTTPIGIRRPYGEPLQYLTLALVEIYKSWEAKWQVKAMAGKKMAWYRFIYRAWQGHRVANDEGVRRNQRAFLEAFMKSHWAVRQACLRPRLSSVHVCRAPFTIRRSSSCASSDRRDS